LQSLLKLASLCWNKSAYRICLSSLHIRDITHAHRSTSICHLSFWRYQSVDKLYQRACPLLYPTCVESYASALAISPTTILRLRDIFGAWAEKYGGEGRIFPPKCPRGVLPNFIRQHLIEVVKSRSASHTVYGVVDRFVVPVWSQLL
jgi:hypothetical protein